MGKIAVSQNHKQQFYREILLGMARRGGRIFSFFAGLSFWEQIVIVIIIAFGFFCILIF